MSERLFSDTVQFQAVLQNLEKNNGQLKCALCGKIIKSKAECHFDHIIAYSKGGKSILSNCQILCRDCNLSKSDRDMQDFLLQEKAKRFMMGESIEDPTTTELPTTISTHKTMTKDIFDKLVGEFIEKKGTIRKVDFSRDKNGLPSITYVKKYYGTMTNLKLSFGLDIDVVWDRKNIWDRLVEFAKQSPDFKQEDLSKSNNMPSLPCILSHFPEYENFSDIRLALGLDLNYEVWSEDKIIAAAKKFLESHDIITQKDLKKENGLPTYNVIKRIYGNMGNFQRIVGSEVSKINKFITREDLIIAAEKLISIHGPVFANRAEFFELFPYSESVVFRRFTTFTEFAEEVNIKIESTKKGKYTKQEVDNMIIAFLKSGQKMPSAAKDLVSLNLPSAATILRFYDDWKEPFLIFTKMIDLTNL